MLGLWPSHGLGSGNNFAALLQPGMQIYGFVQNLCTEDTQAMRAAIQNAVFAFGLLQFQFAVGQSHQVPGDDHKLFGRAAGAGFKVSDFFAVLADDQA